MQPRAELPPAPSRATVVFQLVAVNDPPQSVVVRTMSGNELVIRPSCCWSMYTVRKLREQLVICGHAPNGRPADVLAETFEMPARSLCFWTSNVRVLLGDRVIASNQLVAAFAEPSVFDYELKWARPPVPGRERFSWELAVRQPGTGATYGLKLRPRRFSRLTCRVLTMLINSEATFGFEPEQLPGYSNEGLSSARPYWEFQFPMDAEGPARRVRVDPDAEGLAQAAPVSRIVAEGRVMPPDMPVRVLLELLWGDAPGSWARGHASRYTGFLKFCTPRYIAEEVLGFGPTPQGTELGSVMEEHTRSVERDLEGWRELYSAAFD